VISVRGYNGAATSAPATASSISFSVSTGWTGANPQPQDLLVVAGTLGLPGLVVTQTSGTGVWTVLGSQNNPGANAGAFTSFVAYSVLGLTDNDPVFGWAGSPAQLAWVTAAFTADPGNVMNYDTSQVSVFSGSGYGNTFTPPSATAAVGYEMSVVINSAVTSTLAANTISETSPLGWTLLSSAQTGGDASDPAFYAGCSAGQPVGNPSVITPGSETLASAVAVAATVWQVLLRQDLIGFAPGNGPPYAGFSVG
jgi:hypothetical protein